MREPTAKWLKSRLVWEDAKAVLPGGVSAAARIHPSLGQAFFADRAQGARVWDVDGSEFIDLNMSFGAALLGHAPAAVVEAVERAMAAGVMCGYETVHQAALARRMTEMIPSAELVRFVGSGTEATWHAVRIARAYTGRETVIKFEGHFHGFNDSVGYNFWPAPAGSALSGLRPPIAESAGTPVAMDELVRVLPWNDIGALEAILETEGATIAAIIMEPVNYDSGSILPQPGYLDAVRALATKHGVVLVFDEILSGFRTSTGGAQADYGVIPDLSTFGKALGGGMPLSAIVGRNEVMSAVAPLGQAVHSGTFQAHLVPVLAASAFLEVVSDPAFFVRINSIADSFHRDLQALFRDAGARVQVQGRGARFSLLFGIDGPVSRYEQLAGFDRELARRFYAAAHDRGVYFHYSWHHGFSAAHTVADLGAALDRIDAAIRSVL